eukprot:1178438-Prorocentrum_minimum.AAC.3
MAQEHRAYDALYGTTATIGRGSTVSVTCTIGTTHRCYPFKTIQYIFPKYLFSKVVMSCPIRTLLGYMLPIIPCVFGRISFQQASCVQENVKADR